jgi:ABC-2 type transport system ATP-binding protein
VDPTARRAFWDLIYELAQGGVTVLVTTHYMDEAEYCGRVGMMREGKLLAMDTPAALKAKVIPGEVWEVRTESLEAALEVLSRAEGVTRVGLAGDHLRVIAHPGLGAAQLREVINQQVSGVPTVERGEPTLEDVFLSLAKG